MRSTRSPNPLHYLLSRSSAASNTVLTFSITIYIIYIGIHATFVSSVKQYKQCKQCKVLSSINSVNSVNHVKRGATSISDSIFCSLLIFEKIFFAERVRLRRTRSTTIQSWEMTKVLNISFELFIGFWFKTCRTLVFVLGSKHAVNYI